MKPSPPIYQSIDKKTSGPACNKPTQIQKTKLRAFPPRTACIIHPQINKPGATALPKAPDSLPHIKVNIRPRNTPASISAALVDSLKMETYVQPVCTNLCDVKAENLDKYYHVQGGNREIPTTFLQ